MRKIKLFEEFLNEGTPLSTSDTDKIKDVIKSNSFMSLRKPLTDAGFKVDFVLEPYAMYTVTKKGSSDKIVIINKKYVDNPEFVHGEIAMGLLEKETGSYTAPKFVVRPAAGDTGYAFVAKEFGATPGPKRKKGSKTQEVSENLKGPTSGSEELDKELKRRYTGFEIYPCESWGEGSEIMTGLLAKQDDYTLNNAFIYYWNSNFSLDKSDGDGCIINKYPC